MPQGEFFLRRCRALVSSLDASKLTSFPFLFLLLLLASQVERPLIEEELLPPMEEGRPLEVELLEEE